jgi:CheY-like chemotaxis protein/anti-sigma regulatory factor (Ser/Thr protein kinase)
LVGVAVETARPLIDSKQHQLLVSVPDELVMLEVDSLRLSQVIGNLLTNAAKYTDAKGRIELQARVADAELVIVVRDNGIGMPEEALPGLFTMFSQVNSAIDRAEGGLGIGLALVKGLVELHDGRVEARSEGPNRGSEFIVRLPGKVLVPLAAAPEEQKVVRHHGIAHRARVLVVDDNRDAAESLSMVLSFAGYQASIAYSGIEALEVGARERPRAAIIDIGMPGMSGHEVARRMRREAWGRDAVLVALPGGGQDLDTQAAKGAGFDHHLTKPVDPDELAGVLENLLNRAGRRGGPAHAVDPALA